MAHFTTLTILAVLVVVLGGAFQAFIQPLLSIWGYSRVLEPLNNDYCKTVPQLAACEKLVLHPDSGLLYLACSTPGSRAHWTPAVDRLNESGTSFADYVATYDPRRSRITRLTVTDFPNSARGLSLHGMDVVPSASDPMVLYLYLVNHRAPIGAKAADVGADSVIEIFETRSGSGVMRHVRTIEDELIRTPNDVAGNPDGKSFWVTNDHGVNKVGLSRMLALLGHKDTDVVYCSEQGCKYAVTKMHGNNGIVRASNGTFYVADSVMGGLRVLEQQADNTLVLVDEIYTDRGIDNVSIDSEGYVWAAGFPHMFTLLFKHFENPETPSPSSALRFSVNTDSDALMGVKYKVETMFEDDGKAASGSTSAVYDVERNLLFLHGLAAPHLTVCKL